MNKEYELEKQELKKRQKLIIANLNKKLSDLENLKNMQELQNWHMGLTSFICSFIDSKSKQYHYILRNKIFDGGFAFSGSFQEEKKNAKLILTSLIDAITINGLPQQNTDSGINVNNSTTVNQSQTNNIDVSQLVREEIGNAKIREIEELIKNEKSNESKLKIIAKAMRDFSIETLSSTLAKIILPYLGK